ncbi:MAG: TOBE domain-containing protein [Rhodospirillales bacterium]
MEGQEVYVVIRPEKIEITKQEPASTTVNCMAGEVYDIGYLGSLSIYHVRLPSGAKVKVSAANRSRLVERPITWEDRVWLSWPPSASVVLIS